MYYAMERQPQWLALGRHPKSRRGIFRTPHRDIYLGANLPRPRLLGLKFTGDAKATKHPVGNDQHSHAALSNRLDNAYRNMERQRN